jgi:hypothetical protein
MRRATVAWTANSSGVVSQDTADAYKVISGAIARLVFAPGTGATQPSHNYDVVINTSRGADVLHGTGGNLSASAVSTSAGLWPVGGPIRLGVTNAGASNTGAIDIYWR